MISAGYELGTAQPQLVYSFPYFWHILDVIVVFSGKWDVSVNLQARWGKADLCGMVY